MITIGPITLPFPAKLWMIEIDTNTITLTAPNNVPDTALNLYPNPFHTLLNLSERVDEIIIYDVSGRKIVEQYFVDKLYLEGLNKGLYIAHIKINDSKLVRKIIKQ